MSVADVMARTGEAGFACPACGHGAMGVTDSRRTENGASIRRRRICGSCQHRLTTYERQAPEVYGLVRLSPTGAFTRVTLEEVSRSIGRALGLTP